LYQRVEAFPLISAERYDISLYGRLFRDHDASPGYRSLWIQRLVAESTTHGTSMNAWVLFPACSAAATTRAFSASPRRIVVVTMIPS
jgi:hypothetical protein